MRWVGFFWFAGCQNGSRRPWKYTSYFRYITDSSTTLLWASKKQKINPKTQIWDFMIFFQFFLDAENPYWRRFWREKKATSPTNMRYLSRGRATHLFAENVLQFFLHFRSAVHRKTKNQHFCVFDQSIFRVSFPKKIHINWTTFHFTEKKWKSQ